MIVKVHARIGHGRLRGDHDVGGAAELEQHVAGADDSGREGGADVVGGTADDRSAGGKAGLGGGAVADVPDHLVRCDHVGHGATRNAGERDQLVAQPALVDVREAGLQRPVLLYGAPSGEAPVDVVVRALHRRDAREVVRLVVVKPAQLRGHELLVDAVARLRQEGPFVDLGAQGGDLAAAARIGLLDGRANDRAVGVEQHDGGQHAGDADPGDVTRVDVRRGQQFRHELAYVRPPLAGVLLGPALAGRRERDRTRGEAKRLACRAHEHADGRGSADVETEEAAHAATRRGRSASGRGGTWSVVAMAPSAATRRVP